MKTDRCTRLWRWVRQSWQPTKLNPPAVDPMFSEMDAFQRSAESFRFGLLSWEFWVSPNGQVREWLRHNTRAVVVLSIPALIVIPMIGFALSHIAGWTVALQTIAAHMIIVPVLLLTASLVVTFVVKVIKILF
jgi:hypothetical protein